MGKPSPPKACPFFLCQPITPNPHDYPRFYSLNHQQLTKGSVKAIKLPCKSYRFTL